MRTIYALLLALELTVFTVLFASPAERVESFSAMIQESLNSQIDGNVPLNVHAIHTRYVALAGNEFSKSELREIKFMYMHWCEHTSTWLIKLASEAETEGALSRVIRQLHDMGSRLLPVEMATLQLSYERLGKPVGLGESLAYLFADFGDATAARKYLAIYGHSKALLRLGPAPLEEIEPYHGAYNNDAKFWLNRPEMDQYDFVDADTIRFRGLMLKSGDHITGDLALAHDGILGGFLEEVELFSHAALFFVYRHGQRLIPSVVEIHEKGLRLVPLSTFLNHHFLYYGRVVRPPDIPKDFGLETSREFDRLPDFAYDFQARPLPPDGISPDGKNWLTCSTTCQMFLRRRGILLPTPTTKIHPNARGNLTMMGLGNLTEYYSPTDIFTRSNFLQLGSIDNRRLLDNLAREVTVGNAWVPDSVAYPMSNQAFHPEHMRAAAKAEILKVWAAQQKGIIGGATRTVGGFKRGEVPVSASPRTIGMYLHMNNVTDYVVEQVKNCFALTHELAVRGRPFSIKRTELNPQIRAKVREGIDSTGAGKLFQ